jgi:hypothetical protein
MHFVTLYEDLILNETWLEPPENGADAPKYFG